MCGRGNQLEIGGNGFAHTLHLHQARRFGTEDTGKRSEPVKQRLGDRLGVATRDQPEKQELEDFVIGQCRVAVVAEAGSQAFAVAVVMLLRGRAFPAVRGGFGGRLGTLARLAKKPRSSASGSAEKSSGASACAGSSRRSLPPFAIIR